MDKNIWKMIWFYASSLQFIFHKGWECNNMSDLKLLLFFLWLTIEILDLLNE